MRIEINIGLRTNIGTDLQSYDVAEYAVRRLGVRFPEHVKAMEWRTAISHYTKEGETRETSERTFLLGLVMGPGLSLHAFMDEIELWAVRLHQDCIAVYQPAIGCGELIGPKADEWGSFNIGFFHRV